MNAAIAIPTTPTPSRLPGLLLSVVIALVALGLGKVAPLIGGPVFGIVLGILVRNTVAPGGSYTPGIQFAGKQVLEMAEAFPLYPELRNTVNAA